MTSIDVNGAYRSPVRAHTSLWAIPFTLMQLSAPSMALISEAGQLQEGGQGGVNSQVVRPPTAEFQHSAEISQLTP